MKNNHDEQFLEQAQILSTPDYSPSGFEGPRQVVRVVNPLQEAGGRADEEHVHIESIRAQGVDVIPELPKVYAAAFQDLDQKEPGKWSIAQGESSLWLKDGFLEAGSGYSLELHRAIPVPDKDVPLAEILEFKRKRGDELELLRAKIDGFLSFIEAADDKATALATSIKEIDKACSEAIRVSHEWQFPVRLTNFKPQFEARPFASIGAFLSAWAAGRAAHLDMTTALLGGFGAAALASGSFLKLTADPGWRGLRPRPGPFRYVADYHTEVF